jgi:uncharacterized glyoxalase superfamily protein PhnB
MSDPFEELREPIAPLAPDAGFARDLRRRIVASLDPDPNRPEEQPMPTLEVREYTPARLHTLTPYLATSDPARAIEWYVDVFDARLLGDPIVMSDGRIGHAELRVGDSAFMLAGEFPEENHLSPQTLGGSTVGLQLYVPDCDLVFRRALDAGATELRPVSDTPYGHRGGVLRDPFGHRWFVNTQTAIDDVPVEDAPGRRFGDIGYMTMEVADGARAARFFGELFGWQLHESGEGFHIESITPPSGIHHRGDGEGEPEFKIYFRVDDIASVAARVRELGGQVLEMNEYDSGGNAECVDDQGLRFSLFRPRAGY